MIFLWYPLEIGLKTRIHTNSCHVLCFQVRKTPLTISKALQPTESAFIHWNLPLNVLNHFDSIIAMINVVLTLIDATVLSRTKNLLLKSEISSKYTNDRKIVTKSKIWRFWSCDLIEFSLFGSILCDIKLDRGSIAFN